MNAKMEWTKLDDRGSLVSKDKQYRNLHTWKGKCALCDVEFITHTPGSSPADKVPTITTCDEHRGAPKAIEGGWAAWDGKNVVPGRRMKIGAAGVTTDTGDVAALRQELKEAYDASFEHMTEKGIAIRNYKTVMEENQVLKARLAKYELQPAMEAAKNKLPWE